MTNKQILLFATIVFASIPMNILENVVIDVEVNIGSTNTTNEKYYFIEGDTDAVKDLLDIFSSSTNEYEQRIN